MDAAPLVKNEAEALFLLLLIVACVILLVYLVSVPARIRHYLDERPARRRREAAAAEWIAEYQAETERQRAETAARFREVFGESMEDTQPAPATQRPSKAWEWLAATVLVALLVAVGALIMWLGQWWGPGWLSDLFDRILSTLS